MGRKAGFSLQGSNYENRLTDAVGHRKVKVRRSGSDRNWRFSVVFISGFLAGTDKFCNVHSDFLSWDLTNMTESSDLEIF